MHHKNLEISVAVKIYRVIPKARKAISMPPKKYIISNLNLKFNGSIRLAKMFWKK